MLEDYERIGMLEELRICIVTCNYLELRSNADALRSLVMSRRGKHQTVDIKT